MFSYHSFTYFTVLWWIFRSFNVGVVTAVGQSGGESIVFPSQFLERQRSFDLLTNNAVSSESIVELSRSAEAFSLEYFQVNIYER